MEEGRQAIIIEGREFWYLSHYCLFDKCDDSLGLRRLVNLNADWKNQIRSKR